MNHTFQVVFTLSWFRCNSQHISYFTNSDFPVFKDMFCTESTFSCV